MSFPIIDIHLHPTLKPYGHSFYPNEKLTDATSEACLWRSDPPSLIDEALENTAGFPPYRQADFSSLVRGGANVSIVSLYPIERGFVKPNLPKLIDDFLIDLVSQFGKIRIKNIQSDSFNYFDDLNQEYAYLKKLDGRVPENGVLKYQLIKDGSPLEAGSSANSLLIIPSIEGAHCFCNGNDVTNPAAWGGVEDRIKAVKNWEHPPFFITFNHHFYNGLASHAKSLFETIAKLLDQRFNMNQPVEGNKYITSTGYQVMDLLYTTTNGRRILIDIKHMAKGTRQEFYQWRKQQYPDVPIVCSHSGVYEYYKEEINLDANDIDEICNSNGLIGIEIDQRILGYNASGNRFIKWLSNIFKSSEKSDEFWAEYFWKNVLYIAERCYDRDKTKDPWRIICLGTDFDGVINPLNKFRTAVTYQNLAQSLLYYVQRYWSGSSKIPKNHLGKDAHDVVYSIVYANARDFIGAHYR